MEPGMMLLQTVCVMTALFSLQSSGSIQWPAGTYGIPKPISGCPKSYGFRWLTGWRLQRDDFHYLHEGSESNNSRSLEFHIDGRVDNFKVNRSFCMKEDPSKDVKYKRPTWPRGKYCVYKGNGGCPQGLKFGWVLWEDGYHNGEKDGFYPDGIFEQFTEIWFCCRTDGDKDEPILLPSKYPFFLLAYESAKCQMVKWAVASLEWIYFCTHKQEGDERNGSYPYNAEKMHPTIYYCYYQGCNKTLTAISGTLKSPNFPKHYPNGQYCSWKITSTTTQRIHLVFKSFSLQNESSTDELRVYDGENETGEVLGVFYGGHPPPKEGIYSSSNRMFLIFKSDKTRSYTGFSASYFVCNKTVCRVTTTKAPIPAASITSPHFFTSKTSVDSKVTSSVTVPSSTTQTLKVKSSPVVPTTTSQTSKLTSSFSTQASQMASWSYVSSFTLRTTEVTHLSPITPTAQTLRVTPSPVALTTTAKTSKLTSSSYTQASEMESWSYVISMTLHTTEVTHLSPITPTTDTLIKTTPGGRAWTSTTKVPPKIGYNATLTEVNGTFQSSNCSRNYQDGQYCFWRIAVITAQQIYLIFSRFSLQNENNTDAIYVYDGEIATGEAWEVFYGGHPPPKEGICISSNRIFVAFKSDKAGSYHGFSASYYGVNNSESCAIAASQLSKESERNQTQRKGLNVVAVVVPIVSAILLAALLVAGICYIRKRRKRLQGTDDEIYLRLNSESTGTVEDTDL